MSRTLWSIVLVVALVAPVAALLAMRVAINAWYAREEGAVTASLFLINAYLLVGQYYYFHSEAFYLFVQRQLLRFRRVHTYWRFTVSFWSTSPLLKGGVSTVQELQQRLKEAMEVRCRQRRVVFSLGSNFMEAVIDDRERFAFAFDVARDAVTVTTSRMLVPSYLYETSLDWLAGIFGEIEKAVSPRECQYRLQVTFDRQNPYFGFFVRHVPQNLINHFRCTFKTAPVEGAECMIEVTEDAIYVNSTDHGTLRRAAEKYLTLSDTLITAGVSR